MKRLLFFLILYFVSSQSSFCLATEVIIKGHNPEYTGKVIDLLTYKNQITNDEQIIATTKVSANGDYEWKFDIKQTQYIFCHIGAYHLFIFAEPGKIYEIQLPPFKPKKIEERLNPYFEEPKIHILIDSIFSMSTYEKIKQDSELNFLIRTFDDYYNPFFTKYAVKIYTKQQITEMDSLMVKMEKMFGNTHNSYFQFYCNYKIGLLKFASSRFKSKHISDTYFLNQSVLYANPAYMELFNQVYSKYFVFFGRTKNGNKIYNDINASHSLKELKSTLSQDSVLSNDTLKEFVILKGIHDGCYEMEFSRTALLEVLDSLIKTTKIAIHKEIGIDIREKVTKLLPGYIPPQFSLYNLQNKLVSLSDFKGSYIYLCFCTTQNYACIKDLDQLKRIQEKFDKYLKIITISVDDSSGSARNFVRKKGYNWTFLHYSNQPNVLKDYDIRIFPTYYLINKEGILVWSPAPSPEENFEVRFFEELRGKGIL